MGGKLQTTLGEKNLKWPELLKLCDLKYTPDACTYNSRGPSHLLADETLECRQEVQRLQAAERDATASRTREGKLQTALAEKNLENLEVRWRLAAAREATNPSLAQVRLHPSQLLFSEAGQPLATAWLPVLQRATNGLSLRR